MEDKSEAIANPTGGRKKPTKLALPKKPQPEPTLQKNQQLKLYDDVEEDPGSMSEPTQTIARGARRMIPVHQSRIKDRPPKPAEKDSSLKIKIELDLEVEVEIYARVKGDVTIGLM
jgi:hypothetical protein